MASYVTSGRWRRHHDQALWQRILNHAYSCHLSTQAPVPCHTRIPIDHLSWHWEMRFHKPIQLSPQIDKVEATHLLVKVMENIMHTYSRDIFWLHDRWRLKRNRRKNK